SLRRVVKGKSRDPELLRSAATIAPVTVGKLAEALGEGSRGFKVGMELAPEDFRGRPGDLSREFINKQNEAIRAEYDNLKLAADAGAAMFRAMSPDITAVIKAMAEGFQKEARDDLARMRAHK